MDVASTAATRQCWSWEVRWGGGVESISIVLSSYSEFAAFVPAFLAYFTDWLSDFFHRGSLMYRLSFYEYLFHLYTSNSVCTMGLLHRVTLGCSSLKVASCMKRRCLTGPWEAFLFTMCEMEV